MSRHTENLEPKEALFCEAYGRIDSATYNQAEKSAIFAGYAEKSARSTAWRLKKRPEIQKRLSEIFEENAAQNKGRLLSHLEYNYKEAVKERKWSEANTACKLQAQMCGFLLESGVGTDSPEASELDEQQRADLDEFIAWKHRQLLRPAKDEDSKASATG